MPGETLRFPAFQCGTSGVANVKALAIGTVFPAPVPTHQCFGKGGEVKRSFGQVGIRQAERHAGVVSPLSRGQLEGAAANHVAHLCSITRQKLEGSTHGITYRQA
ncbi:hypothetical protein D3C78_1165770 [compost metagenome]